MLTLFLLLNLFQINDVPKVKTDNQLTATALYDLQKIKEESNVLNLNDVSAEVIFVKEFYGKVLFRKNSTQQKDIASLTKLMSAYLGYLLFKPNDIFVFDKEAIGQEGEVGNFSVGEQISRDNLLKASLVASSNDSIYLLAKTYNLTKFVELMNEKAKEFGMTKTKFVDPTGLKENLSTAEDLYKLLEKIYDQTPEIFNWTTLERININDKFLWTTNLLLPKYKTIIVGGKTGYKYYTGEHLVLILKFKKSPFIGLIILNSKNRFTDAEKIIKELSQYYGN